jgi:hypothetical protein
MTPNDNLNTVQFVVIDEGMAERKALGMDEFEVTFLSVARHLFANFHAPENHCWMDAFMEAERSFPPPFGATIAHAIAYIVEAMRCTRHSMFSYIRNDDASADLAITREERYLVQVLRAMRSGAHTQARTQAMLLCDGGDTGKLLAAIERLCLITGDVSELQFQQ